MQARKIILRVCEGEPACDRAREFVPRVAAAAGVDLELQWFSPSSGYPLPQVFVWDGTLVDRVDDAEALLELLAAKCIAEDEAKEAERRAAEARKAQQDAERSAREELFARARTKKRPRLVAEEPEPHEPEPQDAEPQGPEQLRARPGPSPAAPASPDGPEEPEEPEPPPIPFAIPGGRLGRRRLWHAAPRALSRLLPFAVPIAIAVAWAGLGGTEPDDEPATVVAPGAAAVAAPELDLPTLDGFRFDLARERGSAVLVVLVDGRKPDVEGLARLAAAAEATLDRARGSARVLAVGVGAGLAELRAAGLRDTPRGIAIAADPDGSATAAFAAGAGAGGWWVVDRAGRVVARGPRPGPEALGALATAARIP